MFAIKGGLLNYIIMKIIISAHRDILLDVQGSNVVRVIFSFYELVHSRITVVWSTSSGIFDRIHVLFLC